MACLLYDTISTMTSINSVSTMTSINSVSTMTSINSVSTMTSINSGLLDNLGHLSLICKLASYTSFGCGPEFVIDHMFIRCWYHHGS